MIPIVTFRSAAVQSGVPEEEPDEPEELEEEPVPADDGSAAQLGAVDALAPAGSLEAVPAWDAASVLELPEEQAVRVRPVASEIAASPAFVMACTNRPFAYT
jgi:hypothetical protein